MQRPIRSKKEIIDKLESVEGETREGARILFVPRQVNETNFDQVSAAYRQVMGNRYDTVVILEPYKGELSKKIPMISGEQIKTPFGVTPINERLRDEFCDEEDDFFIDDSGWHENMSLYYHLPFIQCIQDDLSVVSVQLADESPAIVKELAYAMREVLSGRNTLIVICTELNAHYDAEHEKVKEIIQANHLSELMNFLYSGDSKIDGVGVFITGVFVANDWELGIEFLNGKYGGQEGTSWLVGTAGFMQESDS